MVSYNSLNMENGLLNFVKRHENTQIFTHAIDVRAMRIISISYNRCLAETSLDNGTYKSIIGCTIYIFRVYFLSFTQRS